MHPLPFPYRATLYEHDRSTVAAEGVPCAVWPASLATRRTTASATHEAEGRLEDFELWDVNGRHVVIDGAAYTVRGAERQEFLPHTSITLQRIRNGP